MGILRLSDSSMLEVSRVLGATAVCSGFVNGVTSLNDGMAGAGFIAGWIFSAGGGDVCDFTGG